MKNLNLCRILLKVCGNFDKSARKNFLYIETLELFLRFSDTELEQFIDVDMVNDLLKIFDVCRGSDIVHAKVFKIFQKIPLKLSDDREISNILKNFCYFCKIEKNGNNNKHTNVSTHFLYKLMDFFEFSGDHEYNNILHTWLETLKELFSKKLLMDSDLSDFEESQIKNSGLEIKNDFHYFGTDSEKGIDIGENKPMIFDFDFTQPSRSLSKSGTGFENQGFGLSAGEFDQPQTLSRLKNNTNHLDNFDFDDEPLKSTNYPQVQESSVKNSNQSTLLI